MGQRTQAHILTKDGEWKTFYHHWGYGSNMSDFMKVKDLDGTVFEIKKENGEIDHSIYLEKPYFYKNGDNNDGYLFIDETNKKYAILMNKDNVREDTKKYIDKPLSYSEYLFPIQFSKENYRWIAVDAANEVFGPKIVYSRTSEWEQEQKEKNIFIENELSKIWANRESMHKKEYENTKHLFYGYQKMNEEEFNDFISEQEKYFSENKEIHLETKGQGR